MYNTTVSSDAEVFLEEYISAIEQHLAIDWYNTEWKDLRMPLYSALAAELYLTYNGQSESIPRDINEQGLYWQNYYRPSGNPQQYVNDSLSLEIGCKGEGVDLAFVLDGSNSVGKNNFQLMLDFVKETIVGFDISVNETRVALIQYSTVPVVEFYFETYSNVDDILAAIDQINYQAQNTYTAEALYTLREEVFTEVYGARPLSMAIPRVAFVLTDGESVNEQKTIEEAELCHEDGINMFAVGVGSSLNMDELEAVASDPVCMHLILLDGFTEFESLSNTIQERTCEAPIIINPPIGKNGTEFPVIVPPGFGENCKLNVDPRGLTINLNVAVGSATYYISRHTYPNEMFYDERIEANPDMPAALFIPHDGSLNLKETVFCRLIGDLRNHTDMLIGLRPGNKDRCENHQCQQGECVDLGDEGT